MARNDKGPVWKLVRRLRNRVRLELHRFHWQSANRHNETSAVNDFTRSKVHVGEYSYGPLRVIDGDGPSQLHIGSYCSIADGVTFLLNADHAVDRLTTFPLRAFVLGGNERVKTRGDIIVEDDVWIGYGAIVLSGVRLGRGSIVAAGAIVTRDVPQYTLAAGVPARAVKNRLPADLIARASQFDLSLLSREFVEHQIDTLEAPVEDATFDKLSSERKQP